MSDGGLLATTNAFLAQVVHGLGRHDEAAELCRAAAATVAPEDFLTQVVWRGVQSKILAEHGEPDAGEALAREAVSLAGLTDLLWAHGDAMLDLAEVLRFGGREQEANTVVRAAASLYDLKGHVVGAARARALHVI
jgi:ATP/maltotriose-dependent transcriptional regulator MalT